MILPIRFVLGFAGLAAVFPVFLPAADLPPAARDVTVYTVPGTAVAISLSASDPESAALTFFIGLSPSGVELSPSRGVLSHPSSGKWVYTPSSTVEMTDHFGFNASDGVNLSNTATVTVVCQLGGEPPSVENLTYYVGISPAERVVVLAAKDKETPSDDLTISVTLSTTHGRLEKAPGRIYRYTYFPDAGFYGSDSFQYTANDGHHDSAPGVITIVVTRPPVPQPAALTVSQFSTGVLSLSATDPDGDTLKYAFRKGPLHGSIFSAGTAPSDFIYQPDPGFAGKDKFEFLASDSYYSIAAPVTVTVVPANAPENGMECGIKEQRQDRNWLLFVGMASTALFFFRRFSAKAVKFPAKD